MGLQADKALIEACAQKILETVVRAEPPLHLEYVPPPQPGHHDTIDTMVLLEAGTLGIGFQLLRPLHTWCWHAMTAQDEAIDTTWPKLALATLLLLLNPFHYTSWNIRKTSMTAMSSGAPILRRVKLDLAFNQLVLSRHPKAGEAWAHRWWTLTLLLPASRNVTGLNLRSAAGPEAAHDEVRPGRAGAPAGTADIARPSNVPCTDAELLEVLEGEIAVCASPCKARARCYPAWTHRGKVATAVADVAARALTRRAARRRPATAIAEDARTGESASTSVQPQPIHNTAAHNISSTQQDRVTVSHGLAILLGELWRDYPRFLTGASTVQVPPAQEPDTAPSTDAIGTTAPAAAPPRATDCTEGRVRIVPSDYSAWHHRALVLGQLCWLARLHSGSTATPQAVDPPAAPVPSLSLLLDVPGLLACELELVREVAGTHDIALQLGNAGHTVTTTAGSASVSSALRPEKPTGELSLAYHVRTVERLQAQYGKGG